MRLLHDNRPMHGFLSRHHRASTEGVPVLVLGDGTTLGRSDIFLDQVIEMSAEELDWIMGSVAALR